MANQHRITVIDDEKDILDNYRDLLGDDYEVLQYTLPQEFLNSIDAPTFQPPDLVITDLKMPGMDGIEMIRRAQAKNQHFPVILLSGFLDKQAAMDALDIGIYRLLEKPTSITTLRVAIEQLLIEHDVFKVRQDISKLTGQLRELYTTLRVAVIPYIPEDVLNRMIVDGTDSKSQKKTSFEDLLEALESRLDQLLRSEKVLTELREQRYRRN